MLLTEIKLRSERLGGIRPAKVRNANNREEEVSDEETENDVADAAEVQA